MAPTPEDRLDATYAWIGTVTEIRRLKDLDIDHHVIPESQLLRTRSPEV